MNNSNDKKNIAIYISGHLRTFNSLIKDNIKQLIGNHNVDIFIATYYYDSYLPEEAGYDKTHRDINSVRLLFKGLPVRAICMDHDNEKPKKHLLSTDLNSTDLQDRYMKWRMWIKNHQLNDDNAECAKGDTNENEKVKRYDYCGKSDVLVSEYIDFNLSSDLDTKDSELRDIPVNTICVDDEKIQTSWIE